MHPRNNPPEKEIREGPGPLGSTGFGEIPGQHYIPGSPGLLTAPAPGGGFFEGPGGQAPSFAPGGPDNPYPPSAGMPPPNATEPLGAEAYQPGFLGSGAIGSGVQFGQPGFMGTPPNLPPNFPTPGPLNIPPQYPSSQQPASIQSSGAVMGSPRQYPMPKQQNPQPMQRPYPMPMPMPMPTGQGFLARIIPMEGTPGQPLPEPIEPGMPTQPIAPVPPGLGGGPSTGKPRGIKILPMPTDKYPPEDPPKPPGQWVTVDAGRGHPPAYGFIAKEELEDGSDSGLEPSPKKSHSGHIGSGTSSSSPSLTGAKPSGEKSGSEQKGHYVPVQLPGPTPKEDEPIWCWIPLIDEHYGVKHEEKPTPKTA